MSGLHTGRNVLDRGMRKLDSDIVQGEHDGCCESIEVGKVRWLDGNAIEALSETMSSFDEAHSQRLEDWKTGAF